MLKHIDICKRNTSIRLQGTRKILSKNTNKMHEALLKTPLPEDPDHFTLHIRTKISRERSPE